MQPTRRDLRFGLPADKIATWNKGSPHLSHFMNTLSLFFPVGERFFIQSVRNYRERIRDPQLRQAVSAFIGQEAMHGREHEEYNAALMAAVPATCGMERVVARFLGWLQRHTPRSSQLSATIALEHFTAIMADGLLRDPAVLRDADPVYADLWNWHALEETEHKAVAYDVWLAVRGQGALAYLERALGMVLATLIFWALVIPFYLRVLQQQRVLTDVKGWRVWVRHVPLFLLKLVPPWAAYFRPGFHPWDHDNRHYLAQVAALEQRYAPALKQVA